MWFKVEKVQKCAQGPGSPVYTEAASGPQLVVFSPKDILCMYEQVSISVHLLLYIFLFFQVLAYTDC